MTSNKNAEGYADPTATAALAKVAKDEKAAAVHSKKANYNFEDLSGQRFGRLVVIQRAANVGSGQAAWLCKCACGKTKTVRAYLLKNSVTQSCGCLQKERALISSTTHGYRYEKLYGVWNGMKQRCLNPNHTAYKDYGGRGIAVCGEWIQSYMAFRNWAISSGYAEGLEIDRIDVDGDYCPANCRFIVSNANKNNKRNTCRLTLHGVTKTLAEWGRHTGLGNLTIRDRIKSGWSVEDALMIKKHCGRYAK